MEKPSKEQIAARKHFKRAMEAKERSDYDTAISELDECIIVDSGYPLHANVNAITAGTNLSAYYELAAVIVLKYDLLKKANVASDEEFMWFGRVLRCAKIIIEIYEQFISRTKLADDYLWIYNSAKATAAQELWGLSYYRDGKNNLRDMDVFWKIVLPPIRCIAEQEAKDREEAKQNSTKQPEKKSKCFVATAVYGSSLTPEVVVLSRFRDEVLLTSKLGTAFVRFYYFASPPMAFIIAKHESLKTLTRYSLLEPILYFIKRWRG